MEGIELKPELKEVENSIRQSTSTKDDFKPGYVAPSVKYDNDYFFKAPIAQDLKQSFETKNYNVGDAYDKLSDGSYVARYDTYKVGRDNQEYSALNQSTGEKWSNGLQKFGLKTANAVLGGTVGVVYGIGAGFEDGSLNAVYNNKFSNWLSDLDVKLNNQLPNYYTKQEQDKGLGGQLLTANFWSDKVLGGLSFTAGAIISEGIWAYATGGASLARRFAMWGTEGLGGAGRIGGALGKMKEIVKTPFRNVALDTQLISGATNTGKAIALGRTGEALNTLRFTMTSAGYEASVEALQYRKEQEENFHNNFQKNFGRAPSTEETSEFYSNLESSANAVFGVNMALVGSSNLVTMGNIFKIKSPLNTGVKDFFNSTLYGVGKTIPSTAQKISRRVLPFIKNAVTEGLYEEGGQSVTQKVAGKWLEHSYNPKLAKDSFDTMGTLYESLAEQYGTKEGWVENGVGMIIGILGEGVSRNTYGEVQQEVKNAESRMKINETFTQKAISDRFLMMNQINGFNNEAENAEKQGNLSQARVSQDGVIFSMLNNRTQLGDSTTEISKDVQASLNTVSQEQLTEMGVQTPVEEWRTTQLEAFQDVAKSFTRHREFSEYIIGRNPIKGIQELDTNNKLSALDGGNTQEAMIQSLTYTLMGGERASSIMKEAVEQLSANIGVENVKALNTISRLEPLAESKRNEINVAIKKAKSLEETRAKIVEQIRRIDQSKEGDVNAGNAVLRLSDRLAKIDEQRVSNDSILQQYTDEINTNRQISENANGVDLLTDFDANQISVQDLMNLDENVSKLDKVLDTIKNANPQRSANLEAILQEYNNSRKLFQDFQSTIMAFNRGEVKIESLNTWVTKKLGKNKTMDTYTREWMSELLSNYSSTAVEALDDMSKMAEKEEVAPTKENVVEKKINNIPLSETEQTFYEENKQEIDDFLKREPMLPIVMNQPPQAPKTKSEYLKERLEELLKRTNNSLVFIGTSNEDFMLEKPTQSEIEEYQRLTSEKETGGTKVVSEEVIERGQSKGKTLQVTETKSQEEIEGVIVQKTKYKSNIDGREVSLGGKKVTTEEFKNQFDLEETSAELLNALEVNQVTILEIKVVPNESRFESIVEVKIEGVKHTFILNKPKTTSQTTNPQERLQQLTEKLSNWKVLDSFINEEGLTIADIVELLQQVEQQVSEENTLTDINQENAVTIATEDEGQGERAPNIAIAQNTLGHATIRLQKNGEVTLHHISPQQLVDTINEPYVVIRDGNAVAGEIEIGDEVVVNNGLVFTVEQGNILRMKQGMLQLTPYIYVNGGLSNWSYSDLYYNNGSEIVKKPSDFTENITPEEIYNTEKGAGIRFEIDRNDEYTQKLLQSYNDNPNEDTKKELIGGVKIYTIVNNKKVSTVKGINGSVVSPSFMSLRTKAFEVLTQESNTLDLSATSKVTSIYFGSPQFFINQAGQIESRPFTKQATDVVITTGFIENGEITTSQKTAKEIDKTYVNKVSKKTTKKVPIIVVKRGINFVALPIALNKINANNLNILLDILNSEATAIEQAKLINQAIQDNRINTQKVIPQELTDEKIEQLKSAFSKNTVTITAEDLASNYDKANLVADAQMYMDLEDINSVISDPKLTFDVENIIFKQGQDFDSNDSKTSVENSLNDLALELYKDFTANASTKYTDKKGNIIENAYTDVFDDNPIEKTTTAILKLKNVNILRAAFQVDFGKNKILKNAIGQGKIDQVRKLFKALDNINSQAKVDKDAVKSGIKNTNCP